MANAEEILQAEIDAENERIRILNKTPVEVLCPREVLKKAKQLKKQELKRQQYENLPADCLNMLFIAEEDEEIKVDVEAENLAAQTALAEAQEVERLQKEEQAAAAETL